MATDTLQIELVAPEHELIALEAAEVVVPGAAGIFTVLPGHTPFLSGLTQGVVIARRSEEEPPEFYAVHRGFVEVLDDHVRILADYLEHRDSIDAERAARAQQRAKDRIERRDPALDFHRAEAALARAVARLQAHAGEPY